MSERSIVPEIGLSELSFCRKDVKDAWARKIFCGVYYIKALHSGRIYIGSSVWIRKRLLQHKRDLLKNDHDNPLLQNSCNKHGLADFVVGIMEEAIDEQDAKNKEQSLIDSAVKDGVDLFNVALGVVEPNHEHLARTIQLVNPLGETVTITNIQKFCRDTGIPNRSIYRILETNYMAHGWSRVGCKRPEPWKLLDPDGRYVEVKYDEIDDFCNRQQLNRRGMTRVWKGQFETYKGWTRHDSTNRLKLVSPEGQTVSLASKQRAKFCRDNNVGQSSLVLLAKGKVKQAKGWTLVT